MLTLRCREILKILLAASSPVNIKELTTAFNVSERSIKYDLGMIRTWLAQETSAVQLLSQGRQGSYLAGEAQVLAQLPLLMQAHGERCMFLHPKERMKRIALKLLTADDFVTLELLTQSTQVSKNTVLVDLQSVTAFLKTWNIALARKVHWGFRIVTTEMKRRLAIEYLILTLFDDYEIASLLQKLKENRTPELMHQCLCRYLISPQDAAFVYRAFAQIVQNVRRLDAGLLGDRLSVGLLVRLCVSIHRLRLGKTLEIKVSTVTERHGVYQTFKEEVTRLFALLLQPVPQQELEFVIAPFLGGAAPQNPVPLEPILMDIIRQVSALTEVPFTADGELYENLVAHMKEKVTRHQYGVIDPNPLLAGIVQYYGDLFQTVRQVCYDAFGAVNLLLEDEDIAYLVLHFQASYEKRFGKQRVRVLVVCSTGRGAAKLLKARLENEFNAMHVIGCCSVLTLEEALAWQAVDLVVSVLPLEIETAHIVVNLRLSKQNITDIRKFLADLQMPETVELTDCGRLAEQKERLLRFAFDEAKLPQLELMTQEIISKGFQIGLLLNEEFQPYLSAQAATGLTLHCLLMVNRIAFGSPYVEFDHHAHANFLHIENLRERVRRIIKKYEPEVPESEINAILNYFQIKEGM